MQQPVHLLFPIIELQPTFFCVSLVRQLKKGGFHSESRSDISAARWLLMHDLAPHSSATVKCADHMFWTATTRTQRPRRLDFRHVRRGPGSGDTHTLTNLVHVSICATSHPLDELKVMLGVPPLDFTARPGKDVHDCLRGKGKMILLHWSEVDLGLAVVLLLKWRSWFGANGCYSEDPCPGGEREKCTKC